MWHIALRLESKVQSNLDLRDLDLRENLDLRDFLLQTEILLNKKSQFKGFGIFLRLDLRHFFGEMLSEIQATLANEHKFWSKQNIFECISVECAAYGGDDREKRPKWGPQRRSLQEPPTQSRTTERESLSLCQKRSFMLHERLINT